MAKALRLAGLTAAALLAACGKKPAPETAPSPPPGPPPVAAPAQMAPQKTPSERFLNAIELLNQGLPGPARAELAAIAAIEPENAPVADLLRQIDLDPRELLGTASYGYTVRRGETLASIAGRLLGSRNRFWALAKYNNIANPSTLRPGTEIRIPGTAPIPRPDPVPAPRAAPEQPAAPPPPPPLVRRDPVQAGQFRTRGLAALSRGAVDDAVNLLRRALNLDPVNAVIRSDLDRALRVQGALRRR